MRFMIACTVATLALATFGTPHASAQDIEVKGPLAGAPAVIGLRNYREMRFQIQLHSSITLQDEYSRPIMLGGQLMFHPTDWLGIGVWGNYSLVQVDTALTDEIAEKGQTNEVNVLSLPRAEDFSEQIGRIKWMAAPEIAFIPLRGKLGLFEKLFVDTDLYVLGGVGFVGIEEREDATIACAGTAGREAPLGVQIDGCSNSQDKRTSRTAIAPTFGVGLSLYMADFVALTIEWRALPFSWNTSGTDESGDPRGDFPDDVIDDKDHLSHFNHLMTLGFAFYLPTEPSRSHMDDEAAEATKTSKKK
jgi:outer membrane beta-barrel protein